MSTCGRSGSLVVASCLRILPGVVDECLRNVKQIISRHRGHQPVFLWVEAKVVDINNIIIKVASVNEHQLGWSFLGFLWCLRSVDGLEIPNENTLISGGGDKNGFIIWRPVSMLRKEG